MKLYGRHYENGEPVCVIVEKGRILTVQPAWARDISQWPYVAPGLFDLQINGHGGTWFCQQGLTPEEALSALEPHFRSGITRLCPTLITASHEALLSGLTAIRQACERERWADLMVAGCHLEGPYLSDVDGPRGAHPKQHIRPANWEEFQQYQAASGNRIKLVTIAPEREGALEFIRKATASGVVIAIGHTNATTEEITAGVAAGAKFSTHLGNAAHGTIRRHPNYIWDQLGEPRLKASLITDGHHLPPSVVQAMVRAKSPQNVVLTCDAAGLAGCPPGPYHTADIDVEILEDGRIVVAGQRQMLAGSSLQTDVCVQNAMKFAGLSLREAWDAASRNTALLLGCEEIRLRRGARADLVQFRQEPQTLRLSFQATVAAGELRHGTLFEPT